MDAANRFEYKFLLSIESATALRAELGAALQPDTVGGVGGRYPVVSLYYDSPDLHCYWEHWRGVPSRRKLRVRTYGTADGAIPSATFLEIKHKSDGRGAKRRLATTLTEALRLAAGESPLTPLNPADARVAAEAGQLALAEGFRPRAVMRYDRQAFSFESPGAAPLRITFDEDVCVRFDDLTLRTDDRAFVQPVFAPGTCVLEVKGKRAVPAAFATLLARRRIYPRQISKYAEGLRGRHPALVA